MKRKERMSDARERSLALEQWAPKTKLGKQVLAGEIPSLDSIVASGRPIREPEIVDKLVPGLEEAVIAIGKGGRPFRMLQRMTDSGRRNQYEVLVAVGNKAGYIGVGHGKAKEFGPAKRKATKWAKINLFKVSIGCGSWECACGGQHTVPYISQGAAGSVKVTLIPAPKGLGLAANVTSQAILTLAGVKDVWSKTSGNTSSSVNLAWATFNALKAIDDLKGAK